MKYFLQKFSRDFNSKFGWFFYNGEKQHRWEMSQKQLHKKREFKKIAVTGGAGFIGSHLVKALMYEEISEIVVIDSLTYAGSLANLEDEITLGKADVLRTGSFSKVSFEKIDITDLEALKEFFRDQSFDAILHLAAESHVDRSIENPLSFVQTNVNGTVNLLEIAVEQHKKNRNFIFYHISTDEVFGSLSLYGWKSFHEEAPYDPRSPYSASKASSDHFVRAYHHTYGLPILISNCSNNYGTHQYPEKLIPVVIKALVERKPIPIYGSGENKRDWLNVGDHVRAIITILKKGSFGETYCVGGNNVMSNLQLVRTICKTYDKIYKTDSLELITFVEDRKGHDLKYAINPSKIKHLLGWKPIIKFEDGLRYTIKWYHKKFTDENV